ncbi:hypothetical protein [Clostridium septicum]|uniref:Uncharacterized protein n=1 Tax=Clostridium septicum TaxID=1504 RepID=A0A9N7JKS8_CLOSE|nr:hypothetical protein [Clostridium septicum]AYE34409.1 hypothetical protein CP523_08210 [Clostridium septicum]MDU1312528.1 hypothetical protein [Clostridium septicum]QAS59814.1 hypothetical protein EI377_02960 [Clostridium septicum]UEC20947.1 hypothetical protein LK444_00550 [Clostridium septicum]USS01005.1 hypothetical protein NH397_00545 [Clostridium septicum]
MKEANLKLAQQDIDEALKTVEDMEKVINETEVPNNLLREKFLTLTEKVQKLESILKTEGIL